MKESTKDKIEGTAHEVKGAVKEKVGHTTNNPISKMRGRRKDGRQDPEESR
jgi:uncharacterized protein YjbJ (UPF0337 family)